MWVYESPIGNIVIQQIGDRFALVIHEQVYGSYHSAVAAANDVYTFTTGCDEWDLASIDPSKVPSDISGWLLTL